MNFSKVGRLIVTVSTLMTVLAMLFLTVYGFCIGQVGLAIVAAMLMAAFGFFSYRDYMHYFKNKG